MAWTEVSNQLEDGVNLPVDEVNTNHLAGLLAMRLALRRRDRGGVFDRGRIGVRLV